MLMKCAKSSMYFILPEYYDLFTNIRNIFLPLYFIAQTTE